MSLSLGMSPGYINSIENKKALPPMKTFFYICEYLEITPKDFFHFSQRYPETLVPLIADLEALDGEQLEHIAAIVKSMKK